MNEKCEKRRQYHKQWYSNLTREQRQHYIQNVQNAAKKRAANAGSEKTTINKQRRMSNGNYRMARGSMIAETNGEDDESYELNCSELYRLEQPHYCEYCNAKKFQYETPTFCCYNGEVVLAPPAIPEDLYSLFTSQTEEAKEFRGRIRAYNSIFAFTSFGVHLDKELANSREGVYTFKALGQIYHILPSISKNNDGPSYFQLYIYDTDNEAENRIKKILSNAQPSEPLVKKLIDILSINPYAKFFRNLKDIPSLEEHQIIIRSDVFLDQRVYNEPTASQVAAVWIEGNTSNGDIERDIIVETQSGKTCRVKHYFGCYDPLQYPLLFPHGEVGWHQNIRRRDKRARTSTTVTHEAPILTSAEDVFKQEKKDVVRRNKGTVSCREYYCYKLQIRENHNSILLYAGRLLQQYVVDMYIKLETTRLDFCRRQQSTIRAELYQGIVDSVQSGETRGKSVGQRIILPASFIGGPRDMRRRYLDAMALVQRFGKPDIFITMTCNPEWEEIQKELKPGQLAQNRPDLSARIFKAKLQDLKDQLFKKCIFGPVAAHVYVIEFQKRGLPHAHILVIMKLNHKIMTPDQYDKIVSAEIPDRSKYPKLYDLVSKHMIHGPCGEFNINSPCMQNGVCKKHYPKSFSPKTLQGKDSYPIYRRRNNGRQIEVKKELLDNRWVVPYNPYLLTRYSCHINVEICSGLKAVKYLYKYIYKGHDKVSVYIAPSDEENVIDEIKQFQDARWVSPPEAMWRIFHFDLNEMYPSVKSLQLHLPNMQSVCYSEYQNLQSLVMSESTSKTMLTEFFAMNAKNEEARKYLYREFPEHYVWNNSQKQWTARKKYEQIGRVNAANPSEGERYYLRLLLNHIRGPKSFDDLLYIDGIKCSTFKESAQKHGLLETDNSLSECLSEASNFQMPIELRRLFATILVYCEPSDVKNLWDENFESMSQDFSRIENARIEVIISRTLASINFFLQSMGKNVIDYDLPKVDIADTGNSKTKEIDDEMKVAIPFEDITASSNLNVEQDKAYKKIIHHIDTKKGGVFFIDGPGGTGKTYLYRALLATLRSRGKIAIATATSGVAAAIMPGGRTAHSRFKIPIDVTDSSICNITKQSGTAELLRRASLIIWDEAPMARRNAIETLDRTLKDIVDSPMPFGGKVIVFGGDFRQVLPVVRRATRAETVNASLVRSYLWQEMEILKLERNMRALTDPRFSDFLLRLGNGDEPMIGDELIQIPEEMVIKYTNDELSENALINSVFPALDTHASSSKYITQRAILAAKNDMVDSLNEKLTNFIPGQAIIYYSFDSAVDDTQNYYQQEFLNSLMPSGLPPHKLTLKENCPIILLRNLDPSNGLCNGTRMVCRAFKKNVICAEISVGQFSGKQVLLPRIPLCPAENEAYPFHFKRKQFPIRLSFAMTINKAQGQTIPNVGVYLPQHVFSHGQLYVALSRGISMATTKVLIKPDPSDPKDGSYTKNIVYREVLMPTRYDHDLFHIDSLNIYA